MNVKTVEKTTLPANQLFFLVIAHNFFESVVSLFAVKKTKDGLETIADFYYMTYVCVRFPVNIHMHIKTRPATTKKCP